MINQPINPHDTSGAGGFVAELEEIRQRVVSWTHTLWAARSWDELMDGFAAIEALKSSLDALELGLVAELDATHVVTPLGWASTQDFITSVTWRARR